VNLSIIQTSLFWENRDKNLSNLEYLLDKAAANTELIVLPEMFTTGFTMRPDILAESEPGVGLQWMQKMAMQKNAVITGSISVKEKDSYYNRLYWVEPSGTYQFYNKRHLFRMANEDKHYTAGKEKLITKLNTWNVCPMVCYDLRFPVFSRNRCINGIWDYDVLIYVANWPAARAYPWKQLLIARAIENQCYVIGVNRVGDDGNGIAHSGNSCVINPRGEIISEIPPNEEKVENLCLDRTALDEFRKIFPVGLDADGFEISI